ncbi:16S rRNA (guanine(966)-N(2))-methyltransferase RsmD [Laceyella putida]|uniref:16S rRNA (Guanine(966)-N(2))-methyltransferase RsmD n=1 Tax=Laceyella putida TaxID=110101 RepID=A0ABW2RNG5_9BACL
MRIIAGTRKGTRLKMVPGQHVRPTADRVKESLFSVIGPFFDGGYALDLFAGTGSLGLEALSRGVERAFFVDQSRTSCETVKANAEVARLADQVEIIRRDARAALKALNERGIRFDIIFLDPPYHKHLLIPALEQIAEFALLTEDGVVVAEHPSQMEMPQTVGQLTSYRSLSYGDITITLYSWEEKEGEHA